MFLDAAAAFYTAALTDPSRALTSSLEHQLARDIDRCSADQQCARYAAAFPPIAPVVSNNTSKNSKKKKETCEGCAEAVDTDALHELGRTWHRPCFLLSHICAHCGRSIATDPLAYIVGDAIPGTFDAPRPVFHGKCRAEALAGLERVAALPARRFCARAVLAQRHANPGSALALRITIDAGDQHGRLLHRGARGVSHVEVRLLRHETRPVRGTVNKRRTRTAVVGTALSTLGRQLPNDTHEPAHIDTALEFALPATLPRTHTHDTGFAREYELQVIIHFVRFYRRPLTLSFNIVVLGERLHNAS